VDTVCQHKGRCACLDNCHKTSCKEALNQHFSRTVTQLSDAKSFAFRAVTSLCFPVTPLSSQVLSSLLCNFQHLSIRVLLALQPHSFSFERPWTLRSNVAVFRNYAGACFDDDATDFNTKLQLTAHAAK